MDTITIPNALREFQATDDVRSLAHLIEALGGTGARVRATFRDGSTVEGSLAISGSWLVVRYGAERLMVRLPDGREVAYAEMVGEPPPGSTRFWGEPSKQRSLHLATSVEVAS